MILTPEMVADVAQLFAMVQQLLTALGAWGLIGLFVTGVVIIRLGLAIVAAIRA